MPEFPELLHVAIDARDCRALAEFYRRLLGLVYRPGDEPPTDDHPDDAQWLVLTHEDGRRALAFQQNAGLQTSTWPSDEVSMQMHLDLEVDSLYELHRHRRRAEELGARLLLDRSDEPEEAVYVLADPEGHPFCLLTTSLDS
ncbi:VOC family protein [Mobilicoccus massiliensis]|uniref:VOC family protein n=1 Tax=Mobilicoccus massiliensis TaxID=1522310 RepID=UPI00058B745C|nr:VOC family protein [Mobilicoccus massiliensis]